MCVGKCMCMYIYTHFTAVDHAKQAAQVKYMENCVYT